MAVSTPAGEAVSSEDVPVKESEVKETEETMEKQTEEVGR